MLGSGQGGSLEIKSYNSYNKQSILGLSFLSGSVRNTENQTGVGLTGDCDAMCLLTQSGGFVSLATPFYSRDLKLTSKKCLCPRIELDDNLLEEE